MPKPTAKQDRKTNARQKPEMKSIKSGGAMENDSIGSRALSSSTDDDSKRAVGTNHQKNNSTDERVLASGDTESQRAVGANHQKTDSTTSRIIAPNAVNESHVSGSSIGSQFNNQTGNTEASALKQNAVGRRELQSSPGNNVLRAVTRDHIQNGEVTHEKIENGIPPAKLADGIPGSKLAENYAKSADTYLKGTTDDRFLKARAHPDFQGHGNTAHSPEMAVKNHTHSIGFGALPLDAMQRLVSLRNSIRDDVANGVTTAAAVSRLQQFVLGMAHGWMDSPEMTADAHVSAVDADEDYKDVYNLMQITPTPSDAHFLNNRGPDIANTSGVYGTEGTTNQTWYPPKETSVLSSSFITPSGTTATVDYTGIPGGSHMLFIVSSGTNADSSFTAPSGWSKLAIQENSSYVHTFRVYNKQRVAGESSQNFTVPAGSRCVLLVLDNYTGFRAAINNRNPLLDPPDNTPRAFGAKSFPRGESIVVFVSFSGASPDATVQGFTELIRLQISTSGVFYVGVQDSASSDFITPVYFEGVNAGSTWGSLVLNTKPRKKTLTEARAEANL